MCVCCITGEDLYVMFSVFDKHGKGQVGQQGIMEIMKSMGITVIADEVERIMLMVDKDGKMKIYR